MRVIEEKIVRKLYQYMNNRPDRNDTLLKVLSKSNYYGSTVSRDKIVMEAGKLKYKLFSTTLFAYDFDTGLGYITTNDYNSATTSSRIRALLLMLFTEVRVNYPDIFISGMPYEYSKVFKFDYKSGAMLYRVE